MRFNIQKAGRLIVGQCAACVPDDPRRRLMFGVWARGVLDAYRPLPKQGRSSRHVYLARMRRVLDAVEYLSSTQARTHLEHAGVDPDYAARVMVEVTGCVHTA